jgi:hypothetical protein
MTERRSCRRPQVEGAERPATVVMTDIDPEYVLELAAADDQQSVEALAADADHPALDVRVRVRRLHRSADDLDLLGRQKGSNARANFVSWSWIRNRTWLSRSSSAISRLRACCNIQPVSGLLVQAKYSIRRLPIERKTSTYRRRSQTVSTVKKSHVKIDSPCSRRNARHDCRSRCGAGGTPALLRMLRTDVADTATPSLRSSPTIRR